MRPDSYALEVCDQHDDMRLFTERVIAKGELVYSTTSPKLSFDIPQDWYDTLSQKMQKQVLENGYFDESEEVYHADFDILPLIHHSENPTLVQDAGHDEIYLVAALDIQSGSEITRLQ